MISGGEGIEGLLTGETSERHFVRIRWPHSLTHVLYNLIVLWKEHVH